MKVYVYPADETGCGYYRLIWPAQSLQAAGVDVVVVTKKDAKLLFQAQMQNDVIQDVTVPPDADVIVLQRPTHKYLHQAVSVLRRKGVAVVVDMDDDLTCIDPRNPAWSVLHPMHEREHSWKYPLLACENATLVTVSTPALLDVYARKSRGVVLPNFVPHYFTELAHEDSAVVGWGGSVHSHPDDLQTMGPALQRLTRTTGSFTVVGPEKGLADVIGSAVAAKTTTTGAVEFLLWAEALAKTLGIGLAPIADTKFNRAKSWLKPLEYAAVGVPPVSSSRPEYGALAHTYGVGWVVNSPKDWYRTVMRLVTNEQLRQDVGSSWREIVADRLTVEKNAHQWVDAWQLALQIQRNRAN